MTLRIIVAAHGELADALVATGTLIAGNLTNVVPLSLLACESPAVFKSRMEALLAPDTLILTDIRGGTPDNIARLLARHHQGIKVVAGCSLPMLLQAAVEQTIPAEPIMGTDSASKQPAQALELLGA